MYKCKVALNENTQEKESLFSTFGQPRIYGFFRPLILSVFIVAFL